MHEATLAAHALEIAAKAAGANSAKVRSVTLVVGDMAGVLPYALRFAFEAIKRDTPLKNAALRIENMPVRVRCAACGAEYAPAGFPYVCPGCGGSDFRIIQGEELYVKEIEVAE